MLVSKEIQVGAFRGLHNIETLYMNGNHLSVPLTPGMFTGLSSCRDLYISNNMILEIHPGAFQGLFFLYPSVS